MRLIFVFAILLGWEALPLSAGAQSAPPSFPLAGDWQGVMESQGAVSHLLLHMNTTPEGRMTALLDRIEPEIEGDPAIGGSFDGSHLILRFFYWKPNAKGDSLEYKVAVYDATVSASGAEMTGTWTQEGSWPLNFKRLTWQAHNPKPAPPTVFDGDWAGIEHEGNGLAVHYVLHISNTEDGLMIFVDCPEENFKGARASKVSYDLDSNQLSFKTGQGSWTGKMTADGKALETSMTEPGNRFLIHFDRVTDKKVQPN